MMEVRYWGWLVLAVVFGALCYLLAPVLTPFLIAALLAYCSNPLVVRLTTLGLPRLLAVVIIFAALCLLALLLPIIVLPLLEGQLGHFVERWPAYIDWLQQQLVPWLQSQLGLSERLELSVLKRAAAEHWQQMGGLASYLLSTVSQSGLMLFAWLANLVLIPVVTFYLLLDWQRFIAALHGLLPRQIAAWVGQLAADCDHVLATFLRGQLLVMASLALIYAAGLWLAGIEFALLIGLLAGVVSFVPYMGLLVGLVVAGSMAYVQFHELSALWPVLLVFGIGQLLEGFVLTPWFVGDRIGLHPVAVIFAVMACGQLFGFFGVLLALPLAAVVLVLLRNLHGHYVSSSLYVDDDAQSGQEA